MADKNRNSSSIGEAAPKSESLSDYEQSVNARVKVFPKVYRWYKILRAYVGLIYFTIITVPFGIWLYYRYFLLRFCSCMSVDPQSPLSSLIIGTNVRIKPNHRYGPRPRNLVDVFLPPVDTNDKKHKVVIFVHGGAWSHGEKAHYSTLATHLSAALSAVVLVPTYTLYPHGHIEEIMGDMASLFEWIERDLPSVAAHADISNVNVIGHSAGAHLLALYILFVHAARLGRLDTVASKYSKELTPKRLLLPTMRIKSFIGIAGPYEIGDHYVHESTRCVELLSTMKPVMHNIGEFPHHSPTTLLRRHSTIYTAQRDQDQQAHKLPPILFIHSETDGTVPLASSRVFHDALTTQGHKSTLTIIDNLGHAGFVLALMKPNSRRHPVLLRLIASHIDNA